MNPPNTSQSAGTEATKRPPYDGDRAAHAVSDDIDPVNVRYRAGWRLSAVLLGASLGLAGLFAYSSVVHDSPWPLLPGLVSVAIAISFFRTGILGPRISGDILYVPKASQRTLKIPIENISGAYLVRARGGGIRTHRLGADNMGQQTRDLPTAWTGNP